MHQEPLDRPVGGNVPGKSETDCDWRGRREIAMVAAMHPWPCGSSGNAHARGPTSASRDLLTALLGLARHETWRVEGAKSRSGSAGNGRGRADAACWPRDDARSLIAASRHGQRAGETRARDSSGHENTSSSSMIHTESPPMRGPTRRDLRKPRGVIAVVREGCQWLSARGDGEFAPRHVGLVSLIVLVFSARPP